MREGVIKFNLEHINKGPVNQDLISGINYWRRIFFENKLIGNNPVKYGGFDYGNLSQRLPPFDSTLNERKFIITGSQTSHFKKLTAENYATVLKYYPETNRVVSEGPIQASSESMTHGMVYDICDDVRFVFHSHSPEIWRNSQLMKIHTTLANVEYGTPEMANEVKRLFAETNVKSERIFAMGGHEDGIVAFGKTGGEAWSIMSYYLQRARRFLIYS